MLYGAVMYFLMFQMPLTKKTPVKRLRCPICGVGFSEEKDWTDHLVECGRQRMEKQSYGTLPCCHDPRGRFKNSEHVFAFCGITFQLLKLLGLSKDHL